MTTTADALYDLRQIIEREMRCENGFVGVKTHSPSGCPRCQALMALDRLEAGGRKVLAGQAR